MNILIIFFLSLSVFFYDVCHSQCRLNLAAVENTKRIFVFKDNNEFRLLSHDVVDINKKLYMLCDAEDVVETICQPDGTFTRPLPMEDCIKPIAITVEPITDNSCAEIMYKIGYNVNAPIFLEVYRSCYNISNSGALFSIHQTYDYRLVTNRPVESFKTDKIITAKIASGFGASKIYDRFNNIFGKSQLYIKSRRDQIFDRGHLTPSGDFLFPDQMRSTFRYINVVPQFRAINRGKWKAIEAWVRKFTYNDPVIKIATGVIGILRLRDHHNKLQAVYLNDGNRTPVPEWIYKFVANASSQYVFLIYNNIYEQQPQQQQLTAVCQIVTCPELLVKNYANFIYCCNAFDFLNRIMPNLKNFFS